MARILVFQHVAHEILGTFHPLLKQAGFRIRYANFGRTPEPVIDMHGYDGLVVLGGPMGVYEAATYPHLFHEIHCIQQAVRQHKPVLGICLGAQLIAAALEAEVTRHRETEIGWCDVSLTQEGKSDSLLGGLKPTEKIFQWHGDTFELPKGAVWLARSEACAHQAFRFGDKVYGFQFHLEVDEPMIDRWLLIPENQGQLPTGAAEKIRQDTKKHVAHLKGLSENVFSGFLNLFDTKPGRTILGSGHK